MLKIRLFGPGQIYYSNQLLSGFPNQQCYLLLYYLLLNRHKTNYREQLAALFWPDYPTDTTRKYLRNTLWRLKNLLRSVGALPDQHLVIDGETVTLVNSEATWSDVNEFETTITRYKEISGEMLTTGQATALENALSLYKGDLLEGVYVEWCLHDRERLRQIYLDGLNKLMTYYETTGELERSVAFGQRILNYDNVRESTHQQMIRLYWLLGDRDAAIAQYKQCAQILRQEMGIVPMESTRRLFQQVLSNSPPSGRSPAPQKTVNQDSPILLINHSLERLRQLQAMLEEINQELHRLESHLNDLSTGL